MMNDVFRKSMSPADTPVFEVEGPRVTIEIGPAIEVVVFTLAMAVLGALLAGDALRT